MRVLLVTTGYPPEHSGSGKRLHETYTRIQRHSSLSWNVVTKYGSTLCDPPHGPDRIHSFPKLNGLSRPRIYAEALRETRWAYGLARKGVLDGIDVLHCAGWSWMTHALCHAARRRGISILRELTTAGDLSLSSSPGGWFIRRTNRLADRFVAISPALEKAARDHGLQAPIWCRPNGTDLTRFHYPSEEERIRGREIIAEQFGQLPSDATVVIQVGRIRPLKNQLFMADCIARLPRDVFLLIVGPPFAPDDDYFAALKARIGEPDLCGRAVVLAENYRNIHHLMHGADICAMPSQSEGLGNVMIEALSCGLPVVAGILPGVTDWIIRPDENGELAPLEPAAFAEALLSVQPLLSRKAAIADDAAARFDAVRIDHEYSRVLGELVTAPSGQLS